MKTQLIIDTATLPEEGQSFSGELDPSIFSFPKNDTKCIGPLFYDLYIQHFDSELLLRGSLSAPMEFTCVRDLELFVKTLENNDVCASVEVSGGEIDITDTLREEILILFPDYPHCDDADDPKECILDSRYLVVDNTPLDEVKTPPAAEQPNPWAALDAIDDDSSESAN